MNLNYLITGTGPTVVLLHGLFGDHSNLGMIARGLAPHYQVVQIDLRNHGRSPHTMEMNYSAMAADVQMLLATLSIEHCAIIGHSMGGKVAMALTALIPNTIDHLVVLDIAPIIYHQRSHDAVFSAIKAVTAANVTERQQALPIMEKYLHDQNVIQFLLKSFCAGKWAFNVDALYQNYDDILTWQQLPAWPGPALFIKGERSSYICAEDWPAITAQFPAAKLFTVAAADHWVHGEKPDVVLRVIRRFLERA